MKKKRRTGKYLQKIKQRAKEHLYSMNRFEREPTSQEIEELLKTGWRPVCPSCNNMLGYCGEDSTCPAFL